MDEAQWLPASSQLSEHAPRGSGLPLRLLHGVPRAAQVSRVHPQPLHVAGPQHLVSQLSGVCGRPVAATVCGVHTGRRRDLPQLQSHIRRGWDSAGHLPPAGLLSIVDSQAIAVVRSKRIIEFCVLYSYYVMMMARVFSKRAI